MSANFVVESSSFFISTLFRRNLTSFTVKHLVFLPPFTAKYSQLRIPKKNAPVASCPSAMSMGVNLFPNNVRKTDRGRAFCCFPDGSSSMYPCTCLVKNSEKFLSGSRGWSARKFVLKAARTCVTVALTVFPESMDFLVVPNLFRLQAPANADRG